MKTAKEWARDCMERIDLATTEASPSEVIEVIVRAVREECAAYVERNVITGGETIGPLYNIGWDECCAQTAKGLRASG